MSHAPLVVRRACRFHLARSFTPPDRYLAAGESVHGSRARARARVRDRGRRARLAVNGIRRTVEPSTDGRVSSTAHAHAHVDRRVSRETLFAGRRRAAERRQRGAVRPLERHRRRRRRRRRRVDGDRHRRLTVDGPSTARVNPEPSTLGRRPSAIDRPPSTQPRLRLRHTIRAAPKALASATRRATSRPAGLRGCRASAPRAALAPPSRHRRGRCAARTRRGAPSRRAARLRA